MPRSSPLFVLPVLAACAAPPAYSPPEAAGLVSVRPFPTANDVCQVIGENDLTVEYLDDSATLIGCPVDETGAIADRKAEGGVVVGQAGNWLLLSVPDR